MSRRLLPCSIPGGQWRHRHYLGVALWVFYVDGRDVGYLRKIHLRSGIIWEGVTHGVPLMRPHFGWTLRRCMALVEATWRNLPVGCA